MLPGTFIIRKKFLCWPCALEHSTIAGKHISYGMRTKQLPKYKSVICRSTAYCIAAYRFGLFFI